MLDKAFLECSLLGVVFHDSINEPEIAQTDSNIPLVYLCLTYGSMINWLRYYEELVFQVKAGVDLHRWTGISMDKINRTLIEV